jgi:hypothetical protein
MATIKCERLYYHDVREETPPAVIAAKIGGLASSVCPGRTWTGYITDTGRITSMAVSNPCWRVTITAPASSEQ